MDRVRTDIHQHLWPEEFIAELSRRQTPPMVRRRGRDWVLHLVGEPDYLFSPEWHDPARRLNEARAEGVGRIVVSLSSPLGIEWLPGDEAADLLDAYNRGVLELGVDFNSWGAISVLDGNGGVVDRLLDRGHIGISLPAEALSTEAGLNQLAPVLDRLERRSAPLFIHPGPVYASDRLGSPGGDPEWWSALTGYIDQMNRAWHAFVALGRDRFPDLRVVFAMLAGGAPLHNERLVSRGGPAVGSDSNFYYDTSSYGGRAIDALIRVVGIDQIVYGTDSPVISQPPSHGLGPAAFEAISVTNPDHLMTRFVRPAVAA